MSRTSRRKQQTNKQTKNTLKPRTTYSTARLQTTTNPLSDVRLVAIASYSVRIYVKLEPEQTCQCHILTHNAVYVLRRSGNKTPHGATAMKFHLAAKLSLVESEKETRQTEVCMTR